ncbi:MAG: PD-(D/E)XK motif protein [Bacteroidaceae bacterium]|nr:PD-(D/E)XK motif protein [Bacteroidaceae bacterium]
MERSELLEQIKKLKANYSEGNEYNVFPIEGMEHKIGVSKEGYPKFFVCTNDSGSSTQNTNLEILSVEYNMLCTFVDDIGIPLQKHYTIITLRSIDETLQSEFLDIVLMVLKRLPSIPSKREIALEVENLISIFSAMKCPPRKEIQGLWAELLVIERSLSPENLINAWHESPTSKYDFTLGRDKIEVKSTSSEVRKHHFSLDQLNPSVNSRLLIASVIVRESGQCETGLSILDLYDKICERVLSVDARLHLYQVIIETLGADNKKLTNVFFDYVEASDKLKFFDFNDIPGINKDSIMRGVSKIGFDSDLTGIVDVQDSDSSFNVIDSPLFSSLFNI